MGSNRTRDGTSAQMCEELLLRRYVSLTGVISAQWSMTCRCCRYSNSHSIVCRVNGFCSEIESTLEVASGKRSFQKTRASGACIRLRALPMLGVLKQIVTQPFSSLILGQSGVGSHAAELFRVLLTENRNPMSTPKTSSVNVNVEKQPQ